MPLLRMRDASYVRRGDTIVPPATFDVGPGERVARICSNAREAETLAMMAAALARPTGGSIVIGEYDPRVQPVHCKRIAAFVPHDPLPLAHLDAQAYVDYRAALCDIEPERARAHAKLLLERLDGMHEAFAYPILAALLPSPLLLVLDRPHPAFARAILDAAGSAAVFSTHVNAAAAAAFAPETIEART